MSAAALSRFDELMSRYLDEELTPADATELAALLPEPQLATRFLEMTRLNSEIAGLLAAPVPDAAMVELVRTDIGKELTSGSVTAGGRWRMVERTPLRASTQPARRLTRPPPRQKQPILWALAWAAVLFVFAGLAAVFLLNRSRSAQAPTAAYVQGQVRLIGLAGERALAPGESWQRGETLKTIGPNSAATVTFRDGTRLDFGGNSVAVNQSTKEGRHVQLEHGAVQSAVKKQPARRAFVFVTPEAEAIVMGTALRLVTGGHHTRLEVTEGQVRFRRRHDGVEVAVKAGSSRSSVRMFRRSPSPSTATVITPNELGKI